MSAFEDAARELDNLVRHVEQLRTADLLARFERLEATVQTLAERLDGPERTAYKLSEVAEIVGVSAFTLRRWIKAGRLEAEDMGGWYSVPASVVAELVARRSA